MQTNMTWCLGRRGKKTKPTSGEGRDSGKIQERPSGSASNKRKQNITGRNKSAGGRVTNGELTLLESGSDVVQK